MENNTRKEPTFGTQTQPTPENLEKAIQQAKANTPFSVHSTQSPGHTFTPVMTRPNELAKEFSTMEERKMLNTAEKAVATPTHTAAPNTTVNLNTTAATATVTPVTATAPTQAVANPAVASTTTTTTTTSTATAATATTASTSANSNIGKTVQTSHFTFTPADNKHHQADTHKAVETTSTTVATGAAATAAAAATKAVETASNGMERVIPTQAQDNAKKAEKAPSKYRRLLLVGLLALALLLVFFLLKPKTPETVEALQNQGTDLPIEFRPLDEAEAKRAEEEAKALQAQQEAQTTEQPSTENAPAESVSTEVPAQENNVESNENTETATPAVAAKPANVEPIKPATKGSVIHQPETSAKALKPATTTTVKASQPVSSNANTKPAQTAVATKQPATLKPVVQQTKPAATATTASQATKPTTATTAASTPAKTATSPAVGNAVATKSFTIEKGVSLFQKFRDNGLGNNLSELNAMGKVNGATSRLSPGQKVTVRLDKENRIVEMNLGSGKYIRQANGSYIYK